ncbi:MAG: family 78 glycoside hydrolase catalytic domain, partial [Terracoccus sp.]
MTDSPTGQPTALSTALSTAPSTALPASVPAPVDLRVDDAPVLAQADRFVPVAHDRRPRLSWTVPLVRRGQAQSGWQVRASELGRDPATDPDPVWDSGPVDGPIEGPQTLHHRWGAEPLEAHRVLAWRVRSIDERGETGRWSDPAPLETGPFELADWEARWVEVPAGHGIENVVDLPHDAVRARLHLTAQGLVRAAIDGIAVNPDACDPTRTDPSVALVRTYDVTDLLTAGPHTWQLTLARGQQVPPGESPRVLAELVATLADGSTVRSGTGHGSRYTASSMLVEEAFYLEARDARIDATFEAAPVAGDAAVVPPPTDAVVVPDVEPRIGPDGVCAVNGRPLPTEVRPDPGPPLRVVRRVAATLLGSPEPGVKVFDVGENVAGRSRVELHGAPSGSEVTVVHGETMLGGRVSTLNIRLPHDRERERQVVSLVCAGGIDVVEPWFAVHGFRYVEVRDIPAGASVSVSAGVLHTDAPQTGTFTCDDPLVERLVDRARRTQLNNLHGLPEDCPTREQSGWTGDAAASAAASSMHLDLGGTYRKWLGDLVIDQRDDGAVPGVSPAMGRHHQPPDPVWGAAYPVVLEQHWLHTGDESLVREHLPSLGRWCDYQLALMDEGLVLRPEISYGHDWLAPEQTPPVLMQTCAAISCLLATARLEQACGDAAVAALRRQQAQHSVHAARARLCDPVTGQWANGSQGSWALAATLLLDGHDEAQRRAVAAVAAAVASGENRLSSGFATTRTVVAALAEWNHGSGVLACLRQPVQPGVGSMLVDGPGTFWETWWIDTENVGVASLDHIGLAAPFAEWAWTRLAGLRPTGPGWATFDVAPSPTAGVEMVKAVVMTPRGRAVADWRR